MITQKQIKKLLHYNPETGIFTWLKRTPKMFKNGEGIYSIERNCKIWNTRFSGKPAGRLNDFGYIIITIHERKYSSHKLAYTYMTGKQVKEEIDHKNGKTNDNRWINLRPATSTQQKRNSKVSSRNTSGYRGVSLSKQKNKWRARGVINRKEIHLGFFDTPEEASKAYLKWAKQAFGKFFRSA